MEVKVYQLIGTISRIRIVTRRPRGTGSLALRFVQSWPSSTIWTCLSCFCLAPSWWTTIHYHKKVFALLWFPFQLALELNDEHLHYINICSHSYIRWNMVEEIRVFPLGNLVRLLRRPYHEYWLHVYMTPFGERKASMHIIFLADVIS